VTITVHADQTEGPYIPIWNYFGADEPNYVYAPNGLKLLNELSALSAVPVYFRVHNLFTTGNGEGSLKWGSTNVYTEKPDGTPVYDWTITDKIFDAFQTAHIRPLVEIGFMPQALSTHPQPYRHNFPRGDVFTGWSYPPKDYAKWSNLVVSYVQHLKQRYGNDVHDWLWEVWNEPDISYWHGTPEEYDKLYDVTAAAIRQVLPNARIGGPEATGVHPGRSEAFLRQFLEHCANGRNYATGKTGSPLDFISYHPKGSPKFINGHVQMNIGEQLRAIDYGMRVIASFPQWKNTPIILGESDPEGCAACKGSQNGYRNGPLYGVSVAEAIARTYELARKNGMTVLGSVTWAFEFEDQPYFAGFRELATNGIDKAVLNVFRMYGKLGGNWVRVESTGSAPVEDILQHSVTTQPDISAIATRNGRELNVLLWNYHDDDVTAPPAEISVSVFGLPAKGVRVQEFRMDQDHSNAYAVWQKMGGPQHPTAAQQQQLEQSEKLEMIKQTRLGDAGMHINLPRQGVSLLHFYW
jgi:xylan 1,4-beta-xylosidase